MHTAVYTEAGTGIGGTMSSSSLKQQAYSLIKQKITDCEYAPDTMITEEKLQKDIPVSRTPIRDAISRLEHEGLVIIHPKKGIRISSLTITEMNMVYETRLMFEPYAIAQYGTTFDEQKLYSFFRKHNETSSPINQKEAFDLDDEFHDFIMAAIPNIYIQQCYNSTRVQNRRFRILSGVCKQQRLEETNQEHLAIIKACLQKDWEKGAAAMREHLLKSKSSTFEYLLKNNLLPFS
jgi:DNA-binding GntR family transcriptional regulator